MATLNRTAANYRPHAGGSYAVPVVTGSVHNLCPAVTPGQQGILGWEDRSANELRCAVLPDWRAMFRDSVVDSGDVRTIWAGAENLWAGSIAVIGSSLYAFVSYYSGNTGTVECHVADSVENPTSWSLRGTVQTHTAPGPFAFGLLGNRQSGPPLVMTSGRWVLPHHAWLTFAVSVLDDGIGLHYSDDQGATWATPVADRKAAGLSGTAGPMATTLAQDPNTGLLHFGAHVGPIDQWYHYESSDGGSWSRTEISDAADPYYYIDNGTDLYAARTFGANVDLYRVDDPQDLATWDNLDMVALESATVEENDGLQIVPLYAGSVFLTVAFTWRERIARPRSGSHVGYVGKR